MKGGDSMARPNIEAERGRLGMTKAQMCEALGVTSKTYISYIEGGTIPSGTGFWYNRTSGGALKIKFEGAK
jgi:hypothetical protein